MASSGPAVELRGAAQCAPREEPRAQDAEIEREGDQAPRLQEAQQETDREVAGYRRRKEPGGERGGAD